MDGFIDNVTPYRIVGWARDPDQPEDPVTLVVTNNGKVLDRVRADLARADLAAAGVGAGAHGFEVWLPTRLSAGQRNVLRVFRESDGRDLINSPFVLEAGESFGPVMRHRLLEVLRAPMEREALGETIRFFATMLDELRKRAAAEDNERENRERSGIVRAMKPRALVIDDELPDPARDAGSVAILSHVRSLARLGFDVAFLPRDLAGAGSATAALLEREGITLHLSPMVASVEEVLHRETGLDVLYIHRITNADRYAALARALQPLAFLIYSVADLHHLRMKRRADLEADEAARARAKAMRLREFLTAWRAAAVITHSPIEAEILRDAVPDTPVTVVPWAVRPNPIVRPFERRHDVAFVGHYRHAPNVAAAHHLIDAIMPRVWRTNPTIRCVLIGSYMPYELTQRHGDGVEVLGHVPDLFLALNRVRLTVAPLTFGAGIKGKVLESMAHGVACALSTTAAEGLDLPKDLLGCVAESDEAFARIIIDLHEDADLNARCAEAGLRYIADHWSDESVDQAMGLALHTVLPEPLSGS